MSEETGWSIDEFVVAAEKLWIELERSAVPSTLAGELVRVYFERLAPRAVSTGAREIEAEARVVDVVDLLADVPSHAQVRDEARVRIARAIAAERSPDGSDGWVYVSLAEWMRLRDKLWERQKDQRQAESFDRRFGESAVIYYESPHVAPGTGALRRWEFEFDARRADSTERDDRRPGRFWLYEVDPKHLDELLPGEPIRR